ncbi:putative transposase YbfD/YdcC [Desulfofundulus luciae]|uniref:Transposase YbfD/YdcC n=1 Tax=Desulfofundulus luciae TaxID=74702 RepID=A0ABU0AYJ7_9FIRM|nr:hypothetical protein [Desulfofundulus luciae]MDQ0285556.1 putative transposase YbfD/YdcC [Desulfofundulus luciae]
MTQASGAVQGQRNQGIKAFKPVLSNLDLDGKVVTADAMRTQVENARFLVREKGTDYVLPVKQNQSTLFGAICQLKPDSFFPVGENR